jgi:hypothetical protein
VPLSDDQKAMLRLLAQREEGYADIAALRGMSVEEVRTEVRAALDELAAEPRSPAPEPPAPKPQPPAVEAPTPPPEPPPVEAPALPPEPPPPPAGLRPPRPRRPLSAIPPERRRLLALAGGAVGVVAVVLIAIAVFGSDSGSSPAGAGGSAAETASAEGGGLTEAILEPVGGGDASGQAVFGRVGKEEIVLQVTADNLQPTSGGESYTVWLYSSPKLALRVGSAKVDNSGRLGSRFPIPAELLAYVAGGAFTQIYVSRTADAAYEAEVRKAKEQKALPGYSGETVLHGGITGPIVRAGA